MGKKIVALKVLAGELHADPVEIVDELKTYQEYVGGCIEVVSLDPKWVMVVNDNGIREGLAFNELAAQLYAQKLGGYFIPIVGNAIIVGRNGEDFCSIPMDALMYIKRLEYFVKLMHEQDEEANNEEELLQ